MLLHRYLETIPGAIKGLPQHQKIAWLKLGAIVIIGRIPLLSVMYPDRAIKPKNDG